jgi:hypothetical protein
LITQGHPDTMRPSLKEGVTFSWWRKRKVLTWDEKWQRGNNDDSKTN